MRKPLVTLVLCTYNQEQYVRDAVASALAQTYEPLEIILSDDCSRDSTPAVLRGLVSAYSGAHTVIVRQNSRNLGVVAHFNEVLQTASGEFVVLAAGDDISLPQRVEVSVRPLIERPELTFTETAVRNFADNELAAVVASARNGEFPPIEGGVDVMLDDLVRGGSQGLVGAARTVRKATLLQYPLLDPSCPTEDTPSTLRLLMAGTGLKLHQVGLLRRIHESNLSSAASLLRADFDAVEEQYQRDILAAQAMGCITGEAVDRLARWATHSIQRRKLLIRLKSARTRWELFSCVLSPLLSLREKLHFCRRALLALGPSTKT